MLDKVHIILFKNALLKFALYFLMVLILKFQFEFEMPTEHTYSTWAWFENLRLYASRNIFDGSYSISSVIVALQFLIYINKQFAWNNFIENRHYILYRRYEWRFYWQNYSIFSWNYSTQEFVMCLASIDIIKNYSKEVMTF